MERNWSLGSNLLMTLCLLRSLNSSLLVLTLTSSIGITILVPEMTWRMLEIDDSNPPHCFFHSSEFRSEEALGNWTLEWSVRSSPVYDFLIGSTSMFSTTSAFLLEFVCLDSTTSFGGSTSLDTSSHYQLLRNYLAHPWSMTFCKRTHTLASNFNFTCYFLSDECRGSDRSIQLVLSLLRNGNLFHWLSSPTC